MYAESLLEFRLAGLPAAISALHRTLNCFNLLTFCLFQSRILQCHLYSYGISPLDTCRGVNWHKVFSFWTLTSCNLADSSHSSEAFLNQLNLLRLERRFRVAASSTSTVKQKRENFRQSLIEAYQCPGVTALPKHAQSLRRMISGLQFPAEAVVDSCCHVPKSW